ncbi:Asp23/Gls24 family envelope stress response protein [Lentilactobacillus sp. SPB1-3]|uniref:Asp23/Gls24 family envelope stress response protein n=1 Tax=Lentilactobacillus terminaliae TaxID=3003483 RepID=A0ACD5DBW1_9LACO|nr:Asp23/Gls24 family envelope stress response protein [Lentilactobacillus sp. SPB1-3]MCZ0977153.1 Asp23/Gls24 family envelope stress response protein [Lentilactobacillus sp. SPB1-3]
MADETNIILQSDDPELGNIQIAPNVLEIIAGVATTEVDGVNRMRSSLATSLNELIGRKKEHGKGVKLSYNAAHELVVDIDVFLNYGVSVPKVALEIQGQVEQQLYFMTGLKVSEVNVHVQGVVPEKTESSVDPNNPFANDDTENGETSGN